MFLLTLNDSKQMYVETLKGHSIQVENVGGGGYDPKTLNTILMIEKISDLTFIYNKIQLRFFL